MRRRVGRNVRDDNHDALGREKITAPAQVVAVKRVLASQIVKAMNENRLTKTELARRMDTSRSQLNRILDPDSESVTLDTLARAAEAVGRRVKVKLV